jgi:hypothetical protein
MLQYDDEDEDVNSSSSSPFYAVTVPYAYPASAANLQAGMRFNLIRLRADRCVLQKMQQ